MSSNPDPEREGGPNPDPKREGGPDSKKDIFSVLRGSVWSINEVRVWNWNCGIVVVMVVTGKEGGSEKIKPPRS